MHWRNFWAAYKAAAARAIEQENFNVTYLNTKSQSWLCVHQLKWKLTNRQFKLKEQPQQNLCFHVWICPRHSGITILFTFSERAPILPKVFLIKRYSHTKKNVAVSVSMAAVYLSKHDQRSSFVEVEPGWHQNHPRDSSTCHTTHWAPSIFIHVCHTEFTKTADSALSLSQGWSRATSYAGLAELVFGTCPL